MNILDRQIIEKHYAIEDELTAEHPDKLYKVYTATTADDFNPVILKELDEKRALIYETLSKQWNPHVANVYSVHRLENSSIIEVGRIKHLYLAITECVINPSIKNKNATLTNYIRQNGTLDEKTALLFCMQICDGLRDIHKTGYIHKDLKPDNIMISEQADANGLPLLKIIDFGVADSAEHLSDETMIKTKIEDAGTDGYNPHDKMVTARWDIFSIGCILNFMLTGHTPDMDIYSKSWNIRRIIERSTDDFSARYSSVSEFHRILSHEAKIDFMDRVPILRSLPGYRSDTWWKKLVATPYYLLMIYLICDTIVLGDSNLIIPIIVIFWLVLPLIIVFDPFNWLARIKLLRPLRKSTYAYTIVKVISVATCFVIPLIIASMLPV